MPSSLNKGNALEEHYTAAPLSTIDFVSYVYFKRVPDFYTITHCHIRQGSLFNKQSQLFIQNFKYLTF